MKNLKQILLAIFALTFIISCDKDENDPKETLEKEIISTKWVVGNTSEYKSIEFNESGNYIVVQDTTPELLYDQVILFGTYEIINNTTIVLSDLGTLTISEINDNSISFAIQLTSDPGNEIVINASKQEMMESTARTELICRSWDLISINGENVAGTGSEMSVLFSKSGSYLITWYDGERGLVHWKWEDETETKFLYSWDETPVWEEDDVLEIVELTKDILKVTESLDDGTETLFVFKPSGNTKSVVVKPGIKYTEKRSKKGWLKI